jgi:UDP-glucose 4-epimerase
VLGLKALEQGAATTSYNLGNGIGYSVKEVISAAKQVTGKAIPARNFSRRAGDPSHLVGDASRAKKILGWLPKNNQIEFILETAWRWHAKHKSIN